MKTALIVIITIITNLVLTQNCISQDLGEYFLRHNKEFGITPLSNGTIFLLDSGRFKYSGGNEIINWYSSGAWIRIGDTLIIDSDELQDEYIPEIAEVNEYVYDQFGVSFSIQIYVDEETDSTTTVMGQTGIELTIYGNGESIYCQTDSMGRVFVQEISEIDSIIVDEFNNYRNYKIIPSEEGVNSIEVKFDIWEIWFRSQENVKFINLENEKFIVKNGELIDLETNRIYSKR